MIKSKKRIIFFSSFILIFTLLYFVSIGFFGNKITTIVNKPTPINLSSQPRLEDDFYDYVNYKFLNQNNIKEDDYNWYYMYSKSGELIEEEKNKIIDDILKDCNMYDINNNFKKICDYYNSYSKSNNEELLSELNKYIDIINNSTTISEYVKNAIKINSELDVDILVNPKINSELLGSSQPYFTLDIISYDYTLESSEIDYSYFYNDLYNNEEYSQFLNYLKKYDISILEEYGFKYDDANSYVNRIEKMYQEISRFSLKSDKYIEKKGYKIYNIYELQNELNNISILDIINSYSDIYDNSGNILVADINQLKAVDKYLIQDNLETLKNYAVMQILTSYSKYINTEFYNIDLKMQDYFNYYIMDRPTNYASKDLNKKEYIYSSIYYFFQDTITEEFAKRNFTQSEKDFYTNLVKVEIETFKENVQKEEWLSNETKNNALKKLDNISYNVGVPENFIYVENEYNIGNNYINNIISMKQKKKNKLNKQILLGDRMYGTDYLIQNAYYMPLDNSINILLGIIYSYKTTLNLDVNNLSSSYYELLGTIGATIGHELTHSLDSNGSKYDEKGNYINWWNAEDKKNFDLLNLKVIKYYDRYNEFGNTTLGENIADLGGMKLVLNIAEKNNANINDYKKIFESYAKDWCSQSTSYFKAFLLKNDNHSLDKIRTNAVLSSIDKFYEIYNIKPTDKMFVSINDRVSVW